MVYLLLGLPRLCFACDVTFSLFSISGILTVVCVLSYGSPASCGAHTSNRAWSYYWGRFIRRCCCWMTSVDLPSELYGFCLQSCLHYVLVTITEDVHTDILYVDQCPLDISIWPSCLILVLFCISLLFWHICFVSSSNKQCVVRIERNPTVQLWGL